MEQLRTLIDAPELRAGLAAGFVALVACALVVGVRFLAARRTAAGRAGGVGTVTVLGIVGPALVVATLAGLSGSGGLDEVWQVPTGVVVALGALWLAGEVGSRTVPLVGGVLALVGGVILAGSATPVPPPAWTTVILVLGPALAGTAVADFDRRRSRSGLGPQLLLISILGLYATVPDTELVLVLLGAMVPLALLAWPRVWGRLGSGGAYAVTGVFLWITTIEGAPRGGSIVGGVATLALLLTEPLGRRLAPRPALDGAVGGAHGAATGGRLGGFGFVVAQLLLAAYAARVAGRVDDPLVAVLLTVPMLALGVYVTSGRPGHIRHRPGP